MDIITVYNRFLPEERETCLNYNNKDKYWEMYSNIPKHFNKAKKQGWSEVVEYRYEDGTVCGMILTAPARSITIRNPEKKKMSEKQLQNLHETPDDEEEILSNY